MNPDQFNINCCMHVWYSNGDKEDYEISGGFLYSKERGTIECVARYYNGDGGFGVLVLPLDQVDNITMSLDDRYMVKR